MAVNRFESNFSSQGLFSRRSSTNILSDPRILEHLRIVAAEARLQDCREENDSDGENDLESRKRLLAEDIESYNKRNQYGAFSITQKDCDYEGALRFYFENGNQELTKAIRINNTTTVGELLPLLIDKFNLEKNTKYSLYEVHGKDELYLYESDFPLDIAIHALKIPRFVLKARSVPRILPVTQITSEEQNNTAPSVKSSVSSSSELERINSVAFPKETSEHLTEQSSHIDSSHTSLRSVLSFEAGDLSYLSSNGQSFRSEYSASNSHVKQSKKRIKKSVSGISNMLRKKKSNGKHELKSELSTYKLAPGILKVFGDHVSPGSNYKSVRVSTISTAAEVVRQALERYSLEFCNPTDFVLCDVIGHFQVEESKEKTGNQEEQWVTEYVRVINDNEKPLVLQSLWKPAVGRSRRYELRRRIELASSFFFINTASNLQQRDARDSIISNGDESVDMDQSTSPVASNNSPMPRPSSALNGLNGLRNSMIDTSFEDNDRQYLRTPTNCPFLVLLRGFNMPEENVIYLLDDTTLTVGNNPVNSDNPRSNIVLTAPDMKEHFCSFYRKVSYEEASSETNVDDVCFLVFVEPFQGANISINGIPIAGTTLLQPGQLVALGRHYVFMFRDATQSTTDLAKLSWLDVLKQRRPAYSTSKSISTDSKEIQVDTFKSDGQTNVNLQNGDNTFTDRSTDDEVMSNDREGVKTSQDCALKEKSTIQLVYSYEDEDELLKTIIEMVQRGGSTFKLSAGYLIVMMIEHSAATFSELETRRLLLKISSELQGIAWEKTKEIGKQLSNEKNQDISATLGTLIPELKPVVYWMGNALEMLHYLQCNLSNYLLPRDQLPISRESLSSADEELLTVLEEVIMFTFQQTVYHLTKVLYSTLPAILDTNPFQQGGDEDDDDDEQRIIPPSVARIVYIFDSTLKMVQEYCVHPQIIEQLFSYLFFFTNASVLNSLMEKGAGGKFYKWTKGVQIRGNLDTLDDWATQNGLQEPFSKYTEKLGGAVSLLATTKVQLMQMDWNDFRREYPSLNPAQIQQLLGEYHLGGKPRPRGWFPPPEEVEPALRSADVLESFATHPPLLLPTVNFLLDLNKAPQDPLFDKCLEEIKNTYGEKEVPENHGKKMVLKKRRKKSKGEKHDSIDIEDGSHHTNRKSRSMSTNSANDKGHSSSDEELKTHKSSKQRHPTPAVQRRPSDLEPVKQDINIDVSSINKSNNNRDDAIDQNVVAVGNPTAIQIKPKPRKPVIIARAAIMPTQNKNIIESTTTETKVIHHNGNGVVTNGDRKHSTGDVKINGEFSNGTIIPSDSDESLNRELQTSAKNYLDPDLDDVYVVDLIKKENGLGLGLIDGLYTPLKQPGIFVKTIVKRGAAAMDGRLNVGDRILAVNGTTLIGADYTSAMELIRNAGSQLNFLVEKSDTETVDKITVSVC